MASPLPGIATCFGHPFLADCAVISLCFFRSWGGISATFAGLSRRVCAAIRPPL
jgi:hypothetical protein